MSKEDDRARDEFTGEAEELLETLSRDLDLFGTMTIDNSGSTVFSTATGLTTTTVTTTFNGLPVVGFAAQSFQNGTLPGTGTGVAALIQSNYGGNFVHKTTRSIQ